VNPEAGTGAAVLPDWVTDPSELQDMVIQWVVEWLVNGLWNGAVEVVGWVLELFRVAVVDPSVAAGRSLVDGFGGAGDAVLGVLRELVSVLQAVASSSPFAPIYLAVLAGLFLALLAYLARGTLETAKLVSWK